MWPACVTSLEMGEGGVRVSEATDGGMRLKFCAGSRGSTTTRGITRTCPEAALAAFSAAAAARITGAIKTVGDNAPVVDGTTTTPESAAKEAPASTATETFWAGRAGGSYFDRPLREVPLPPALVHLELLGPLNDPLKGVEWPPSLEILVFGGLFNQSLSRDSDSDSDGSGFAAAARPQVPDARVGV